MCDCAHTFATIGNYLTIAMITLVVVASLVCSLVASVVLFRYASGGGGKYINNHGLRKSTSNSHILLNVQLLGTWRQLQYTHTHTLCVQCWPHHGLIGHKLKGYTTCTCILVLDTFARAKGTWWAGSGRVVSGQSDELTASFVYAYICLAGS